MKGGTVVFDLDGTLVDTAADLTHALNHVLRGEGLAPLSPAAARRAAGLGARAMIETGFHAAGAGLPEPERLERLIDAFIAFYKANIAVDSRPYPGCAAALDGLRAKGWTLAVCSNKREALCRRLLAALGLAPRFAAIVGADSVPFRKPHPDHLRRAIAAAGGEPRRAVMIGDAAPDVDAARAAGVPVIGFQSEDAPDRVADLRPDLVIGHFNALEEAVARLARAFAPA